MKGGWHVIIPFTSLLPIVCKKDASSFTWGYFSFLYSLAGNGQQGGNVLTFDSCKYNTLGVVQLLPRQSSPNIRQ